MTREPGQGRVDQSHLAVLLSHSPNVFDGCDSDLCSHVDVLVSGESAEAESERFEGGVAGQAHRQKYRGGLDRA